MLEAPSCGPCYTNHATGLQHELDLLRPCDQVQVYLGFRKWGLRLNCSSFRAKKKGRVGSCIFIQFWANKSTSKSNPELSLTLPQQGPLASSPLSMFLRKGLFRIFLNYFIHIHHPASTSYPSHQNLAGLKTRKHIKVLKVVSGMLTESEKNQWIS